MGPHFSEFQRKKTCFIHSTSVLNMVLGIAGGHNIKNQYRWILLKITRYMQLKPENLMVSLFSNRLMFGKVTHD